MVLNCSLFPPPSAQIKDLANRNTPARSSSPGRRRECSEGKGWQPSVPLRENGQAEVSSPGCQQPKHDQAGLLPLLREGENHALLLGDEVRTRGIHPPHKFHVKDTQAMTRRVDICGFLKQAFKSAGAPAEGVKVTFLQEWCNNVLVRFLV